MNSKITPVAVIDQGYLALKAKCGEKWTGKYFEQVDRLIDPNENEVVEYRHAGVVTKEGDRYIFNPLMDMDLKVWRLSSAKTDVTDQFADDTNLAVVESEKIVLRDIEGFAVLSGTDQDGLTWTQFEVDEFAEQEPGECDICGKELWSGWVCLDGGDEVCDCHVSFADDAE